MWCFPLVPVRFYLFKVNNRNIRRPKISNLKNGYQYNIGCCSGAVIVNFRHISHLVYLFLSTFHKKLSIMRITFIAFLACLMLQHCNKSLNQNQKDVIDYIEHYMKDYMGYFYPIWIKHSGVILSLMAHHQPQIRKI